VGAAFHQRTSVRLTGALLVALAATATWVTLGPRLVPVFDSALEALGPYAYPAFVVVGGVALSVCAPASLLFVTAGTVFGLGRGILLGSAAALLGSTLAFFISRSALGDRVARVFAKSARLDRFEHALSERGVWLVVLLRLSLLAPLGPVSYALGVMRIPIKHFFLAAPALVPTVVVYAYAGHMARSLFERGGTGREPWQWAVLAIGFVATALVTYWIGHAATRALRDDEATPARA
jgi:uncharacterized membrane protein YdjX (TVP38/TMEM64 family)